MKNPKPIYYACSTGDKDSLCVFDRENWEGADGMAFYTPLNGVVLDLGQLKLLSRQIRKRIKQLGENK